MIAILNFILWLTGFILIAVHSNAWVAFGMFIVIGTNNVAREINLQKKLRKQRELLDKLKNL
ncbi:MAG: hypothetical protein ACOCTT_04365 [archaeon]